MLDKMTVVLSGGQDSTTCLWWSLLHAARDVRAVFINYGQRHIRERKAARTQAALAKVPLYEVDVPDVLIGTSPLVSSTPLEQYESWDKLPGGLEKTFVPMRNQFFLTIAANRALNWGCNNLVTGVCQEDFGGYPDCRRVFIDALQHAIRLGTFVDVNLDFSIHTPLMDLTKAATVGLALSMPRCYEALAFTHTSYDGNYPPTGHDHATLLRAKGFAEAGVPDPLVVRAFWEGKMVLPVSDNYVKYDDVIRHLTPDPPPLISVPIPEYAEFMVARLEMLRRVL